MTPVTVCHTCKKVSRLFLVVISVKILVLEEAVLRKILFFKYYPTTNKCIISSNTPMQILKMF